MNQMIQRIREEKKGFTLAELLVVVAIVAVLVAIAIPVFSSSLDKANAQTDAANIRAGYAAAMVETVDGNTTTATWFSLQSDGSVVKAAATADGKTQYACKGEASKLGNTDETIGGQTASSIGWNSTNLNHIYYSWTPGATANDEGTLTITTTQPATPTV